MLLQEEELIPAVPPVHGHRVPSSWDSSQVRAELCKSDFGAFGVGVAAGMCVLFSGMTVLSPHPSLSTEINWDWLEELPEKFLPQNVALW